MSGSGGGGSSTTVQKADPWVGIQPALTSLYTNASDYSALGGPAPVQQQVAPFNATQQQAMNSGISMAQTGSAASNAYQSMAQQMVYGGPNDAMGNLYNSIINNGGLQPNDNATSSYLTGVLNGDYLNSNPYLDASMNAADSATTRNFNTAVMPQLASQFSLAGRYGSGAQSQGISDATNNLATQLSNTNAGIMNTNYQTERGNQQNVASMLNSNVQNAIAGKATNQYTGLNMMPTADSMAWNNLSKLGSIGDVQQANTQQQLNNSTAYQSALQQQPYQNLQWLSTILNGGMSLNGTSSTTTGAGSSSLQSGLGGALSGAALGNMIGGAGSSGGMYGAIGGGILGLI